MKPRCHHLGLLGWLHRLLPVQPLGSWGQPASPCTAVGGQKQPRQYTQTTTSTIHKQPRQYTQTTTSTTHKQPRQYTQTTTSIHTNNPVNTHKQPRQLHKQPRQLHTNKSNKHVIPWCHHLGLLGWLHRLRHIVEFVQLHTKNHVNTHKQPRQLHTNNHVNTHKQPRQLHTNNHVNTHKQPHQLHTNSHVNTHKQPRQYTQRTPSTTQTTPSTTHKQIQQICETLMPPFGSSRMITPSASCSALGVRRSTSVSWYSCRGPETTTSIHTNNHVNYTQTTTSIHTNNHVNYTQTTSSIHTNNPVNYTQTTTSIHINKTRQLHTNNPVNYTQTTTSTTHKQPCQLHTNNPVNYTQKTLSIHTNNHINYTHKTTSTTHKQPRQLHTNNHVNTHKQPRQVHTNNHVNTHKQPRQYTQTTPSTTQTTPSTTHKQIQQICDTLMPPFGSSRMITPSASCSALGVRRSTSVSLYSCRGPETNRVSTPQVQVHYIPICIEIHTTARHLSICTVKWTRAMWCDETSQRLAKKVISHRAKYLNLIHRVAQNTTPGHTCFVDLHHEFSGKFSATLQLMDKDSPLSISNVWPLLNMTLWSKPRAGVNSKRKGIGIERVEFTDYLIVGHICWTCT